MNGVSFSATTENRKGILLDPRTKLVLLLTITTLMFSTSNEGIMNIVKDDEYELFTDDGAGDLPVETPTISHEQYLALNEF